MLFTPEWRRTSPENILFETCDEDSNIKLVDFGLARKHTSGTPMSTIAGTPYYLAPEGEFRLLYHANRVLRAEV